VDTIARQQANPSQDKNTVTQSNKQTSLTIQGKIITVQPITTVNTAQDNTAQHNSEQNPTLTIHSKQTPTKRQDA